MYRSRWLEVREDAGLEAFEVVCGLHRSYHKARILCRSIYEHMAGAALVQETLI